jgi:hypothetical protein
VILPEGQKVQLPKLDREVNAQINGLLTRLYHRRLDNVIRQTYYDNKRAIAKVGTLIPPQYFRLGLALGWSGKAVDLLARRCNLNGFDWPDGKLSDIGGDDVWDDNHLGAEVDAAIVAALIHGPAFLVNTLGESDEPTSLIHVLDATEATGEWNRRKRSLDSLLSVTERNSDGKVISLALYVEDRTLVADRSDGRWEWEWQDHNYGVPAEVLPYKPRPKRPFGSSRITRPIMGLQDAATRALIRLEGHMDVYSYPELWMLGADPSIFKNADGTAQTAWQIRLGRIKGIPDDDGAEVPRADVKQIPGSDPTPHLADINALAKLMAREASLPDTSVAISDIANPTSAESYDASQYELIAEAEGAIDDFRPALIRSFTRALAIQNGMKADEIPETWKSIDTNWRNPRYQSRAAEADAGTKQLSAVPWLAETEVGLELLGLTPQQRTNALAERRRISGRAILEALTGEPADVDTSATQ